MTWKRLVVLVAAALCTTCGTLTVHGQDVRESDLLATIEGLGVCGPVHRSVLDLAPRAADGRLDTDFMNYEEDTPETSSLLMKISAPGPFAIADQTPAAVRLFEFSGMVQALMFYWPAPDAEKPAVVETTEEALRPALGEPERPENGQSEWSTGSLTILASQPSDDFEYPTLLVACTATEDPYFAAFDAAEEADTAQDVVEVSDETSLPPNPWLDRTVLGVLSSWGQPLDEPVVAGPNVVGLHYRNFMDGTEVPLEGWWWFVDGRAVYVASDFMPPRGSSRALSSYRSFKNGLRRDFGAPDEEGVAEATGQRHIIYRTGPQQLILTLFDPDGDPWFRLEIFDTTKLDALPTELRPNRKLP